MRFVLPILTLCLCISPAKAFNSACNQNQPARDLAACIWDEYKKLDAELNNLYKTLVSEFPKADLSEADKKKALAEFIEAEKGWIKYRDADCRAVYTLNGGGEGSRFAELDCVIDHTEDRMKNLRTYRSYIGAENYPR